MKVTFDFLLQGLRLTKDFIPSREVLDAFSRTTDQELLTALFYTIGSAQAIEHLQNTCRDVRQHRVPFPLSAATVRDTLRLSKFLKTSIRVNVILRRYHLVCLIDHCRTVENTWRHTGTGGLRKPTWTINQMMTQADPEVVHPAQQANTPPEYTAATAQLMQWLDQARN